MKTPLVLIVSCFLAAALGLPVQALATAADTGPWPGPPSLDLAATERHASVLQHTPDRPITASTAQDSTALSGPQGRVAFAPELSRLSGGGASCVCESWDMPLLVLLSVSFHLC